MTVKSVAIDLWSRDIKSTDNLCSIGRDLIVTTLGDNGLLEVDKMLNENWNTWTKEMYDFFDKQNN